MKYISKDERFKSLVNQLEKDLGRDLTEEELRHIDWLSWSDMDAYGTFKGIFSALYAAGKESASDK